MKKLLFLMLAVVLVFALVACEKEETQPVVEEPVVEEPVVEEPVVEEPVGVGNTDESMVALMLESYLKEGDENIEEVIPVNIKVYSAEEIEADEAIKSHGINEGDIVFDAQYELKIKDTVSGDDLMRYTAATGEIDGNTIREKYNLGILRSGEAGYTMDAFGTGW